MKNLKYYKFIKISFILIFFTPVLAFSQLFNKNLNSEFKVNDSTNSAHFFSRIAVDTLGNFVIVWLNSYNSFRIMGQRYSKDGLKLGNNFKITDELSLINGDSHPSIAINNLGNILVVWHDYRYGNLSNIYSQLYSSDGIPVSSNIKINDFERAVFPSVCSINDKFVITWGRQNNIYLKFYNPTDLSLSELFVVSELENSYSEPAPLITKNRNGNFLISWTKNFNSNCNICMQRFDEFGNKINSLIQFNQNKCPRRNSTSITLDDNENISIAWASNIENTDYSNIYFQKFTINNNQISDSNITISNSIDDGYYSNPSLALINNEKNILVWDKNEWDKENGKIYASIVSTNGEIKNDVFNIINQNYSHFLPSIVSWHNLVFITWTDKRDDSPNWNIYAKIIDINNITDIVKKDNLISNSFSLENNYPNPFNPSTTIRYFLRKNDFVNLVIYNTLGQNVSTLVNEYQTSGKYSVQFNASNLPSGVYFYKIESGNFSKVNKMLLLR